MENGKLKTTTKISYACGDLGCCVMGYFSANLFMFYCTNMMGISLAAYGFIFFFARIWDAINDLGVGALVDRTHSKYGKARSWIIYTLPLCVLSIVSMFLMPENASVTVKMVWATVTFFLYALFYTTVNLPYGSLMPLMTKNSGERASLSSFRFIGSMIGTVLVAALGLPLVSYVGDLVNSRAKGYSIVVILLCLIGTAFICIMVKNCHELSDETPPSDKGYFAANNKENSKENSKEKSSILKDVSYLFRNKPWVIAFLMIFLYYIAQTFISSSVMYYYLYVLGIDETASATFTSITTFAILPTLLIAPTLIRKFGYKIPLFVGGIISTAFSLLALAASSNITLVIVFVSLSHITGGLVGVAGLAMVSDSIEYGDLKFGRRLEGLGTAAFSFATKTGPALGGLLVSLLLTAVGLDTTLVLGQQQSAAAVSGIKVAMFVVPAICRFLTAILALIYPLTKEKYEQVVQELKKRNEQAV